MPHPEHSQTEDERRRLADYAFLLNVTAAPDASPFVLHELVAVAQRLGLDDDQIATRDGR